MDRKTVIEGLTHCMNGFGCFGCPYSVANKSSPDCQLKNGRDALALLKEQQAEIERLKENIDTLLPVLHGEWEEKEYSIGKCYAICSLCKKSSIGYANDTGFGFEYSFPNYCPHCGAKMKDGDGE